MSAEYDFSLCSGDTPELAIPIRDTAGNPAGFTTPRVIWMLSRRPEPSADEILVTKDSGAEPATASITKTNNLWTATVPLLRADTDTLQPGRYFHAARVEDGDLSYTVVRGIVTIAGSIPIPEPETP